MRDLPTATGEGAGQGGRGVGAAPPGGRHSAWAGPDERRPVLIVLHQEFSRPGKLGQMLQAKGYPLDVRRPPLGDSLPETLADHSGAVVFGGPMSANDSDDFIRREIEWMSVPLEERAPLLGICLGAQMLVKQLGGTVCAHCEGCVEVGFYPIRPTEAGRQLTGDWPDIVYQWHREGFDLPAGAELLARGELFDNQAFRYGPAAVGLQFHSELTYAMVCRWTVRGEHRFDLPRAQPRREHMAGWFRYDPPVRAWLDRFLDVWLSLDARQAGAPASERTAIPV
ncbi:MAG TPA: glutamine amidotransferase [Afifellaceae bacterium]|nr:glutamine amidotransferase [Afifellaceae bacterium]